MSAAFLRIEDLCFSVGTFRMERLSLEIATGEYFVVTGPNGAGKTVLLKLIAGLYQPDSGAILINGRNVIDLPPWRRGLGMVLQEGLLFPNRTVEENIAFGLELRRVSKLERQRAAAEMAERLGITSLLSRRTEMLSGGERQRVALARTLVLKPPLLLLDEPISAADEQARDTILCHQLKELQREGDLTVIHVAHSRSEIDRVADRVGHLVNGQITRIEITGAR
ncbi:MAG: ATP-binding cassette domain-containing protein [Kiritimatiellae bacterium]|nr:ATP-binding cassette domain-containing protein [Kiritimatiellia bacterium]